MMQDQPKIFVPSKFAAALPRLKLGVVFGALLVGWMYLLSFTALATLRIEPERWYQPAIVLALLCPAAALAAVSASRRVYLAVAFLFSISYFLFFPPSLIASASALMLLVGLWRLYERAQFELTNHVKFSASALVGRTSSALIIAFLAAVSVGVYGIMQSRISSDPAAFWDGMANSITRRFLPVLERQIPGFVPDQSIEQYLLDSYRNGGVQSVQPPPEITPETLSAGQQELQRQLGVEVGRSETLSEVTRRAVSEKIDQWVKPYAAFLPAIYSLAIFSILRVVGIFIRYAAILWGVLFFKFLRAVRFVRLTKTEIVAERIDI